MGLITPYFLPVEQRSSSTNENIDRILLGLGRLAGSLSRPLRLELSRTLEVVNSYYSNRMEGNPTRIGDIFSAREGKLAESTTERDFQLEHLAHLHATETMKGLLQKDAALSPAGVGFLRRLHQVFYEALPASMQTATLLSGEKVPVEPGQIRSRPAVVGHFQAPPPEQISVCLEEFEKTYDWRTLARQDWLPALAAAHHRFLWIHPFGDGNGRVVRLFTEAVLIRMGYAADSLYSVSRALARRRKEYDEKLAAADAPRWNDLDGRGSLSLRGLVEFTEFFLDILRDQVEFMGNLLEANTLRPRFERFLHVRRAERTLSASECAALAHLLKTGEMRRGDIRKAAGVEHRQASKIAAHLASLGLVRSSSPKGPLTLQINRDLARFLFPEFFE